MTSEEKSPIISIIVPVYNAERFLARCLDSLVNQTYPNLEIICVNDGSTDHSREILEQYAANDTRINVLNKKNSGPSSARNDGLAQVTGQYVMFLDSDDWMELNACEIAMNEIHNSGADVVFWNYIREFESVAKPRCIFGNQRIAFTEPNALNCLQRRFVGLYGEELNDPSSAHSIGTVWGKIYKAELLVAHQFIDTSIIGTEDELFNLIVFEHAESVVYLPSYLNHYSKDNLNSFTIQYKEYLQQQWHELFRRMRLFIVENHKDSTYYEALDNRIALSLIDLGLSAIKSHMNPLKKWKKIRIILRDEEYASAISKLDVSQFPSKWKLFFWSAKHGWILLLYTMLSIMNYLIGK